jgi:hypothetical protein
LGRLRFEAEQGEDARLVLQRRDRTPPAGEAQAEGDVGRRSARRRRAASGSAGDAVLGEAVRRRAGETLAEAKSSPGSARHAREGVEKVVLPAPFGPMMPTSSPGANAR